MMFTRFVELYGGYDYLVSVILLLAPQVPRCLVLKFFILCLIRMWVEVREQCVGISSLLSLLGSWLNSGCQDGWEVPLHAEPSSQPSGAYLFFVF